MREGAWRANRLGWRVVLVAGALCALAAGCEEGVEAASPADRFGVAIAGRVFQLEMALDAATQFRGLSGRGEIEPYGGMVFAHASPQPLAMVMRDCPAPIDVAFLDHRGRVIATHAMVPEPPRGPDESRGDYERRLRVYPSGRHASFAVEVAGGRLAELGVASGDVFHGDWEALIDRVARGSQG